MQSGDECEDAQGSHVPPRGGEQQPCARDTNDQTRQGALSMDECLDRDERGGDHRVVHKLEEGEEQKGKEYGSCWAAGAPGG